MTRTPDIFRDSVVSRVLRWMVYQGEVSSTEFKAKHVALGGTTNSTHAFDRYFEGIISAFTPSGGSYGILQREGVGTKGRVRWIGSPGNTFFERASNWLQLVALKVPMPTMRIDAAFFLCRENRDDVVERAWCAAVRRKLVVGTEYLAPVAPRYRLLERLTNAEIEDWHGYCETKATEGGGDPQLAWLDAVRAEIARRESAYWARRRSA